MVKPLWALFPSFVLKLWSLVALEVVGNELGKVVFVDEEGLKAVENKVAWVLVDVDISKGLI